MDETTKEIAKLDPKEITAPASIDKKELDAESISLINQIVSEQDGKKLNDLTNLFNINQNKKTIIRLNKLNDLLDTMTQQAIDRFNQRPDEISNQELLQGLKVIQDNLERGQKQISNQAEVTPLIQVNKQEININGDTGETLDRDSKNKVKNAVMSILAGLQKQSQEDAAEVNDISDIVEIMPDSIDSKLDQEGEE